MRRVCLGGLLLAAVAASAQQEYPLHYRYQTGQVLWYLSTVEVSGDVAGVPGGGEIQRMPLRFGLEDRLRLRVLKVDDGGRAEVEFQLRELHWTERGGFADLALDLTVGDDDQVTVKLGEKEARGPVPTDTEPGDQSELATGLKTASLLAAARPTVLTLAPNGELLDQSDPLWPDRLRDVPMLGQIVSVFREPTLLPPMLPAEPVRIGQEWRQLRLAPIPGGDETYELDVHYAAEDTERVGAYDTVRVSFQGEGAVADQPFELNLFGGEGGGAAMLLPLLMRELSHTIHGDLFIDATAGRLVELRQTSEVEFDAVGRGGLAQFALQAKLEVRSKVMLLTATPG